MVPSAGFHVIKAQQVAADDFLCAIFTDFYVKFYVLGWEWGGGVGRDLRREVMHE